MRKVLWILTVLLALSSLVQPAFAPVHKASAVGRGLHISADPPAYQRRLPPSALSSITAAIGRDQVAYHAVAMSEGFRLNNRQSGLSADFTRHGVRIRSENQAIWVLALEAYGENNSLQPVAPAKPHATSNRVEYSRGTLSEWYMNGPAGLEQGFTIAKAPTSGKSGPLTLALAMSGNLKVTVNAVRTGLTLSNGKGLTLLRYGGLRAFDADGQELHSWLEVHGKRLLVRVDAVGARYPVVVDPWVQVAKLTESSPKTSYFLGISVSISADGRTVVAGAPYSFSGNGGAVYVFVRSGSAWADMTQTAKLTASDEADANRFGRSVSVNADGSAVVTGASSGVYVFVRPSTGWVDQTENAKLTATEGQEISLEGPVSLSADGTTVVAGYQGAAYVFVRPSNGWVNMTQSAELTASDGQASDYLGYSVSVSADGSIVAAGAPSGYSVSSPTAGAAYVFVRPSNDWVNMTQSAKLTSSDGQLGDALGYSVSLSGDGSTVVAGAPFAAISSCGSCGAEYVFAKAASGWADETETAKLTSSDGIQPYALGVSVATSASGSVVVAEVPISDAPPRWYDYGAAYIFVEPAGGWSAANRPQTETAKLPGTIDQFFGSGYLGYLNTNLSLSADGLTLAAGFPDIEFGATGAASLFSNAVPFDEFQVNRLSYSGGRHSTFNMSARFVLGTGSNGMDPMTQPLTLVIGGQVVAIHPRSFTLNGSGNYIFAGVNGGIRINAHLRDVGASEYVLGIVGSNANLAGITNPVAVTLSLGNNTGTTQVNANIH